MGGIDTLKREWQVLESIRDINCEFYWRSVEVYTSGNGYFELRI